MDWVGLMLSRIHGNNGAKHEGGCCRMMCRHFWGEGMVLLGSHGGHITPIEPFLNQINICDLQ